MRSLIAAAFAALALSAAGASPGSAAGRITVSDVSSARIAGGADLGGYALQFAGPSPADDGDVTATLSDTGGPLSVDAVIHVSAKTRTGILSGTIRERDEAAPALRDQLSNLAQLHARTAQGRIPVDLEFTF